MNKMKQDQIYKETKGQALLFVVVAMTIALAVGINASVRTISSLSRTSRTDTASRALAAAEGGIERYLQLSTPELEQIISGNCVVGTYDNESGTCLIEFDTSGDVIVSQAFVSLERFEPDYYPFKLEPGQVKEVNLYDYNSGAYYGSSSVEICWTSTFDPARSQTGSEIMYLAYDDSGVQARGGLTGDNPPSGDYESGGFENASGGNGEFDNCEAVDITNNVYGLRIRSMGGPSSVGVYPTGGERLPLQGYVIESVGRISQETGVTATRTISVIRSLPYLPVSFDYALYSEGPVNK